MFCFQTGFFKGDLVSNSKDAIRPVHDPGFYFACGVFLDVRN